MRAVRALALLSVLLWAGAAEAQTTPHRDTFILSRPATGNIMMNGFLLYSTQAPGTPTSCGTGAVVTSATGTAAFKVVIGTAVASCTLPMPTAKNGWACAFADITTNSTTVFLTKQTATTVNSVTFGNFSDIAASANWVAADTITGQCGGF